VPVSVLLDDPTPCRNPLWYEGHKAGRVAEIPNSFTAHFADVIERHGARGKFSVVPCPGGQGRLDQGVPGVSDEDLQSFLRIVRERIEPTWSTGPEMMTHNRAYDLATGGLLREREDAWGDHQTVETLTPYISLALQILRNVGLEPTGVTSPWRFAIKVEDAYNDATVAALRDVCGVRVGWYFLHDDSVSPAVPPVVRRCDSAKGEALVSLVSASRDAAGHADFAWRTQFGEPARVDSVLSADGLSGRLTELFPHGEPMVFHTHWQSLWSNGTGAGLAALEEVFDRINRTWGEQVRWMSARELAEYAAAKAAVKMTTRDEDRGIDFVAPFPARNFTARIPRPDGAQTLQLNGQELMAVGADEMLGEGTWRPDGRSAVVTFSLSDGAALRWR
jgi:hypothetical protein